MTNIVGALSFFHENNRSNYDDTSLGGDEWMCGAPGAPRFFTRKNAENRPDGDSAGDPPDRPVSDRNPYRFGGTTPKGFDCSGFIGYVYRKAARRALPRTTAELARTGRAISPAELRPADLIYFEIERKSLHAGIYIGDGKFIHAPSSKGKVNIQRLDLDYWRSRYLGARRVL